MFPPELVDVLLDFVHSDSATLSACTLVCRDWLPSARFHLLSQLALDSANAESFFDDLDAIGAYSSPSASHRDTAVPKFAAIGLGNVTSLRIDGLDLSTVPMTLTFPNLQSLSLEAFEADSFAIITTWIIGFPSLRSLTLSGDWDGDETEILPLDATIPKLSHLDLNCPLKILFDWFLSLAVVPVTSSLVLRDIWSEESPAISRYLAASSASLESLVLMYPRKEVLLLNLAEIVNIRTLSFECYAHAMPRIVRSTLESSRVPNLETLRMHILGTLPGFPSETDLREWHQVNEAISELQLSHLRSIQLRGLPYGGMDLTKLLPGRIGTAIITTGDI
ncbi:hypothetical protein DFH09DRAFT_984067 [Mycena vulgaris]|nr:hypothetical protein DFH09DRAFT_984067 [Mycena vulgaris]